MIDRGFWSRQRVLLTGHTGFKGSWASLWLEAMGATVAGYALAPDQTPDLFSRLTPFKDATSAIADLADAGALATLAMEFRPTVALHMAAQPLVRRSYADPAGTFATNVQGTVNLLEAVRHIESLHAVLVVTTDKVYRNDGVHRPFIETDPLGGSDPYSASKAGAELAAAAYARSFFEPRGIPLATARAGNVIGGGDWSEDRLVPDVWRSLHADRAIALRYPAATRPWQHVLEPLSGYFTYLQRLTEDAAALPRALNFGPASAGDTMTVSQVVEALQSELAIDHGWHQAEGEWAPEMKTLELDSRAAMVSIDWRPLLSNHEAVAWTADWYRRYDLGEDPRAMTLAQIHAYEARA